MRPSLWSAVWLAVIGSVGFIAALFVVLGRSDPASIARGRPDA